MADPAKKREATYQDVLDAPEHLVAEIINGELRLSPRPAGPHAGATSALGYLLGPPFSFGKGGPGGWIILFEPELHFGRQVVVPDLAGWRRERLPSISEDAFFTLAPDWLCETLSPSTRKMDRAEKLPIYAAAGVQYVWFLDPRDRTLEVLRLHEGKWLQLGVHKDDETVRAEPFEAIAIELGSIWADLPPPPPKGTRAAEGQSVYDY
jgi:Uma2 family endonuclease